MLMKDYTIVCLMTEIKNRVEQQVLPIDNMILFEGEKLEPQRCTYLI